MADNDEKVPDEIKEARAKFTIIQIHAPTLDDNMRPSFELLNTECHIGNDGRCGSCEHFEGAWVPEGSVFSFASYEGYCSGKKK